MLHLGRVCLRLDTCTRCTAVTVKDCGVFSMFDKPHCDGQLSCLLLIANVLPQGGKGGSS